jgi:hypothetical protein
MSLPLRILIVVVAFCVATVLMYVIDLSLGIERGSWKYAISTGVIGAVAVFAWRITAPKNKPPQSN